MHGVGGSFSSHLGRISSSRSGKRRKEIEKVEKGIKMINRKKKE